MRLKHYNAQFITGGEGLMVGAGTEVRIRSLTSAIAKRGNGDREIMVTAVVELTARGTLFSAGRDHACHACGATAPDPDDDGLWYILENHDGSRLLFACAEEGAYANPERDSYPVPGWTLVDGELTCGECAVAIKEAMGKVRSKRRKL